MFTKSKLVVGLFVFTALSILMLPGFVRASEGVTELRSTTEKEYRCVVDSHQAQDRSYRLLVTCRDLIYPSDANVFGYVMWANPLNEGEIIRLGQLQYGKKLFNPKRPFTSIFVTTEPNPSVKTPKGPVVMQGSTVPRAFLDTPTSPTPTPEGEEVIEEESSETEGKENGEEGEEAPSTKSRFGTALSRASAIGAVILLIGSVIALIVILRSKKR